MKSGIHSGSRHGSRSQLPLKTALGPKKEEAAAKELQSIISLQQANRIRDARDAHQMARRNLLKAKATRDALPNMNELNEMLEMYDKQLLADVQAIRDVSKRGFFGIKRDQVRSSDLRPHYKALVNAYENEFEKNKGLTDDTIIRFFDNYVHDSLAGFAKDATIPSDPRVVYLGGDKKYEYARLHLEDETEGVERGIA